MAKSRPVPMARSSTLRLELERLYEEASSPEEFIHVLFAFLSELTARDVRHPLVKSLAEELGRAATQPLTQALVHDLGNNVMAALNTVDVLDADVRAVASGRIPGEQKAQVLADVFSMVDDLREMLSRAGEMVSDSRSLTIEGSRGGRTSLPELLHALTRTMDRSSRAVRVELVEVPDVVVRAPQLAIHRVLVNLVQNAVDAARESEDRKVLIKGWTSDVDAFVQVEDHGAGIRSQDQQDVFELFYTTKPTGSGMGLFVCRTLVSSWGGYLQLDSDPGEGSRFTFSIPRADST